MKKLLAIILAGSSVVAMADTFQDFNNNLYAEYNFMSPNGGTLQNVDQWGVGGTFQSKNNVWANASAVFGTSGTNGTYTQSSTLANMDIKAGYAFQFFGDDANGLQVIPHVGFGFQQAGGAVDGTVYTYSLGIRPEYRFLSALKVSLDANLVGTQQGASTASGSYVNNGQDFGYSLSPEVQYDISKTVMLALAYTYSNSFNTGTSAVPGQEGSNGTNTLTAKVGYLF
jgi:hypothetical protein